MWRWCKDRRNLFGWGLQNLKQIWTGATMGRAECKEREAYGISSLHLTAQTAQGSGPLSLFSFPSSFGGSATMQVLVLLQQVEFVLFAVGMSLVCRREKRPNGGGLSSEPEEIKDEIADRMKLSLSLLSQCWNSAALLLSHPSTNPLHTITARTRSEEAPFWRVELQNGWWAGQDKRFLGVTSITGNRLPASWHGDWTCN